MKILPLVSGIRNDIASSGVRLKIATTDGYRVGQRTAQIYKQNNFTKYLNISRSIGDKVIKSTKKEDIPYVAGAIGMILPLPLMCPLMLFLGFLVRVSIPDSTFNEEHC